MGLMMGVIGFSLLSGGGAELGSSQRNLLGILQKARTLAASTGLNTRLIIHSDSEDEDKYHRYMELIVQDPNATNSWMVEKDEIYFEEGIYFVPSNPNDSERPDDWKTDAYSQWSHDDNKDFKLKDSFKGLREEGQGTNYQFVEFDRSGNLVCPSERNQLCPFCSKIDPCQGITQPGGSIGSFEI